MDAWLVVLLVVVVVGSFCAGLAVMTIVAWRGMEVHDDTQRARKRGEKC